MIRSWVFTVAFYGLSTLYVLACLPLLALPGREPTRALIRGYARAMLRLMRVLAGIRVRVQGQERLPAGAFIIAAKHQSYGDGFVMMAHVERLSFVTGDHLEKIPLVGGVLKKLGAIVVESCGGSEARRRLSDAAAAAHAEGRRILIYPEGHLAAVGERFRYRTGVWHMYRDFDLPVVPVATNLGLRWPQQRVEKHPGLATVEFLEVIPTGLPRAEFMERLEQVIETRTAELVAEATGAAAPSPSRLVPAPDELARRARTDPAAAG